MNLIETLEALEAKNTAVAIDIGEHGRCTIDSNCPVAVELRKIIVDAGITLEQLLEGFTESRPSDPVEYTFAPFSGKMSLSIAGTIVETDLKDVITGALKAHVDNRLATLKGKELGIKILGLSLYSNYQHHIKEAGKNAKLPQLKFTPGELSQAKCYVTSEPRGNSLVYAFYYPTQYRPEYLIDQGTRYTLDPADLKKITQDMLIKVAVSKEGAIFDPQAVKPDGTHLIHYHSSGGDGNCWGGVHRPQKWDGRLRTISDYVRLLDGSLRTINYNSVMNPEPTGMPKVDKIRERVTKVGKEGIFNPKPAGDTIVTVSNVPEQGLYPNPYIEENITTDARGAATHHGWGRR